MCRAISWLLAYARRLLAAFLRICHKAVWIPIPANVEPPTVAVCHSLLKRGLVIRRIKGWGIYRRQKHQVSSLLLPGLTNSTLFPSVTQITTWHVADCLTATRHGTYRDCRGMLRYPCGPGKIRMRPTKPRVEELTWCSP